MSLAGRIAAIVILGAACLHVYAAPDERNLLANPSFDSLGQDGNPNRWSVFVMPKPGAYGRLSTDEDRRGHTVELHNPESYATEPSNNWSQTVYGEFGGRELVLSGSIKTEDATEAALWVQCWHRDPLRVLASFTSSTEFPIYGDTEWEEAHLKFTVPVNTQFLVVRCVLKGEGTAWFDDLRLMHREDAVDKGLLAAKDETASEDDTPKAENEESPEEEPEEPAPTPDAPSEEPAWTPARTLSPDERALILDANATLRSALDTMSEQNQTLLRQIQALQAELSALRDEVRAKDAAPAEPQEPPKRGHILVPRGHVESDTP